MDIARFTEVHLELFIEYNSFFLGFQIIIAIIYNTSQCPKSPRRD